MWLSKKMFEKQNLFVTTALFRTLKANFKHTPNKKALPDWNMGNAEYL